MIAMSRAPRAARRTALAILLVAALMVLVAAPYVSGSSQPTPSAATQSVADLTEVELPASAEALAYLADHGISSTPSQRAGYLHADVTQVQLALLARSSLTFEKGDSFLLVQGSGLSGEASVLGLNSNNINIVGNNTVWSNATVAGAPSGKTVIRADVTVNLKYPQMCNIYIMAFHPSMTMWSHIWNGNEHTCTADLNQSFNGIHDFDFADINGVWKLQVQETNGQSTGFLDGWSIRLYYTSDATATPTRTATPSVRKQFLPVIIADL